MLLPLVFSGVVGFSACDLIIVTFAFEVKKFLESMLGFDGLSGFILIICSLVLIGPGGDNIGFLGILSKLKLAC